MSSQSSVYDDPVESFDKLNLDDLLDDSFNRTNKQLNQSQTSSKTNEENSKDNNLPTDKDDKEDYLEEFFNVDNQHRLENKYCIWFSKLSKAQGAEDYESKLKIIGKFETVEQFWMLFSYFKRPSDFETLTEIHIFRDDVKPTWEHKKNQNGGKFIIKVKKGVVSRIWENLLIAFLGEQFIVEDEINGVVLSIRHYFDTISIWNSNSKNRAVLNQIRETLRRVLNLSENFKIDYKSFSSQLVPHEEPKNLKNLM